MRIIHATISDLHNTEYNFDSYVFVGDTSDKDEVSSFLRKFGLVDDDIQYYFTDEEVPQGVNVWQTDEFQYEMIDEMGGHYEISH